MHRPSDDATGAAYSVPGRRGILRVPRFAAPPETRYNPFITNDPERDTAEHLAEDVALFHPRLVGLTEDPEAIRRTALALKVFHARVPVARSPDYTMDHTGFAFRIVKTGEKQDAA